MVTLTLTSTTALIPNTLTHTQTKVCPGEVFRTSYSEIPHKLGGFLSWGWDIFSSLAQKREWAWTLRWSLWSLTMYCGVDSRPFSKSSNFKHRKSYKTLTFLSMCPQRSARTMAEYTLSTTTREQRSGMILGPKGETETVEKLLTWMCVSVCMCLPAC